MAEDAIVFALANPDPEVDPAEAIKHATVVATGRSDFPNQINNVLAFPGVFRGLLDSRATEITPAMLLAAAKALASVVSDDELNAAYITPSVFHADVHHTVAHAVRLRPATGRWDSAWPGPRSDCFKHTATRLRRMEHQLNSVGQYPPMIRKSTAEGPHPHDPAEHARWLPLIRTWTTPARWSSSRRGFRGRKRVALRSRGRCSQAA